MVSSVGSAARTNGANVADTNRSRNPTSNVSHGDLATAIQHLRVELTRDLTRDIRKELTRDLTRDIRKELTRDLTRDIRKELEKEFGDRIRNLETKVAKLQGQLNGIHIRIAARQAVDVKNPGAASARDKVGKKKDDWNDFFHARGARFGAVNAENLKRRFATQHAVRESAKKFGAKVPTGSFGTMRDSSWRAGMDALRENASKSSRSAKKSGASVASNARARRRRNGRPRGER